MSTTDNWVEVDVFGSIQLHRSSSYVMVKVDTGRLDAGWYLFDPDAAGIRVDPGDDSSALNLILASRAADTAIADFERPRPT